MRIWPRDGPEHATTVRRAGAATGRGVVARRCGVVAVTAVAILAAAVPTKATPPSRPIGDSRVVAQLPPAPGYPEGIAIEGTTVYVATAARFGSSVVPPSGPPEVQGFDLRTGELVSRVKIADKDPSQDHGLSGLAFDRSGRLYVLDTQWGIIRFTPARNGTTIDPGSTEDGSKLYASSFPDLKPCGPLQAPPCSPSEAGDKPPLPNDIAFDAKGNAYVSDSLQATIYSVSSEVPATGTAREPRIFFQDRRLAGAFGTNGLRIAPEGDKLYVVESVDDAGRGHIYRLPLENPSPADLEEVHSYVRGEVPDNLAFGGSGKLYVALAGTNQVQMLRRDGSRFIEERRFGGPARRSSGTPVPYDMPSGVALHSQSGSLLVNNHSEVLGLPAHFVVFDVFVDDRDEPLIRPAIR